MTVIYEPEKNYNRELNKLLKLERDELVEILLERTKIVYGNDPSIPITVGLTRSSVNEIIKFMKFYDLIELIEE